MLQQQQGVSGLQAGDNVVMPACFGRLIAIGLVWSE